MPIPNAVARLHRFQVFSDFDPEDLLDPVNTFIQERRVSAGATLYHQGDPPDYVYLVEEGEVLELGRDRAGRIILRRRAQAGDGVGRRSMLDGTPRRATATVTQDATLLAVNADGFKTLLAMFPVLRNRLQRIDVVNRLLAIPLFSGFAVEQLYHVADLARLVRYPAGQIVFRQGEKPDGLYVIDTGQVVERVIGPVPGTQTWPKYLTAGSFFGRYSLLNRTKRRATAQAVTDVALFRFNADAFEWLRELQPEFEKALKRHDLLGVLRGIPIFSRLSEEELKHLAGYVGLAYVPPEEEIYRQGEIDPTLYILSSGEAVIRYRDEQGKERPRGYIAAGQAVGETSLFLKEPRDVTIETTTATTWLYLTRADLDQYLDQRPGVRGRLVLSDDVRAKQNLPRLPWLEPDERLVLQTRRHWYFLVSRLILPVLVLLAAVIILVFQVAAPLGHILAGAGFLWLVWRVIDWTNDYYVITTKRVAHREKVLLISETRDETPLDKVQNVNVERDLVGNVFGFGALLIDTAARTSTGVEHVTFTYLANPQEVQELVFLQVSRVKASAHSEMRRTIRDRLETTVGASIRPTVPRPAVPSEPIAPPPPKGPGIGATVYQALWGRYFWIEKVEGERIIWRKHLIRLLVKTWLPGLVALVLAAGLAVYLITFDPLEPLFVAAWALLLALALFWLWWNFSDWGNDQYIVTNDRIIDIDRLPLGFRTRRTETTFDRIQNVNFEIPNPIATILKYGTVMVYTAGGEGRLDFLWVRDPKRVQAEVFRRLTVYEEAQRNRRRDEQWEDLPEWFAVYEQRRKA